MVIEDLRRMCAFDLLQYKNKLECEIREFKKQGLYTLVSYNEEMLAIVDCVAVERGISFLTFIKVYIEE